MMRESQSTVEARHTGAIWREMSMLPAWSIVVAVVEFLAIPFVFFYFSGLWSEDSDAPRFFQILVTFLPGTLFAFLTLTVGYVNRDAGRRGMSRTIWTLIVILVPNAIGFILYFLMRDPIVTHCPKCGAAADQRANFCPNCRHSLQTTCPQCSSVVRSSDKFCANCGLTLGPA
jgi:hypothetical protein